MDPGIEPVRGAESAIPVGSQERPLNMMEENCGSCVDRPLRLLVGYEQRPTGRVCDLCKAFSGRSDEAEGRGSGAVVWRRQCGSFSEASAVVPVIVVHWFNGGVTSNDVSVELGLVARCLSWSKKKKRRALTLSYPISFLAYVSLALYLWRLQPENNRQRSSPSPSSAVSTASHFKCFTLVIFTRGFG
ncbi:unnamed protein product [Lactuca saligna]|uniref:Uncharacterized protein n=1 Tax=Lactuca saligna TaxID=75948 RepID=A0AA36E2M7_LACSI|nr:unnamed protein product [Lactuca saligna]